MGKSSQAHCPWKQRKRTPHEYAIWANHPVTKKRVRLGLAVALTRPDQAKIQADLEKALEPEETKHA